jgi:hypothetical protein
MRQRILSVLFVVIGAVVALGCESRTDKTEGGVILSVSDFNGLPVLVSVNNAVNASGLVQVESITVTNVVKDPGSATSELMNVEISSYEVVYSRADTGTRLPPPFVRNLFGVAPVGGDTQYDNLPVLGNEQFFEPPLSELLFLNGGFDRETGTDRITLNLRLRFFGRTLSGDAVETAPASFTVEFVP